MRGCPRRSARSGYGGACRPRQPATSVSAISSGETKVGTFYRRTRKEHGGQRAEICFDGLAGALLVASTGGSSIQFVLVVKGADARKRRGDPSRRRAHRGASQRGQAGAVQRRTISPFNDCFPGQSVRPSAAQTPRGQGIGPIRGILEARLSVSPEDAGMHVDYLTSHKRFRAPEEWLGEDDSADEKVDSSLRWISLTGGGGIQPAERARSRNADDEREHKRGWRASCGKEPLARRRLASSAEGATQQRRMALAPAGRRRFRGRRPRHGRGRPVLRKRHPVGDATQRTLHTKH